MVLRINVSFPKQQQPVELCSRDVIMFPARYKINIYALFIRKPTFKRLIYLYMQVVILNTLSTRLNSLWTEEK
jgi:hypothetical protein